MGLMDVTYSKRHFVMGILCEIKEKKKIFPAYFKQSTRGIKRYVQFVENAALTKLTTLSICIYCHIHSIKALEV